MADRGQKHLPEATRAEVAEWDWYMSAHLGRPEAAWGKAGDSF